MPVAQAIAAPRFHHQHLPDEVDVEDDSITAGHRRSSSKREGYKLVLGKGERMFGAANAIVRTKDGWQGAADPRGGGAAIGD